MSTQNRRKSRRLVRKESLWSRVKSAPFDFLLSVSESIETIHWDSLTKSVAVPGGIAATLVLLLCRIAVDRSAVAGAKSSWSSGGDDIFAERSVASSWVYAIVSLWY